MLQYDYTMADIYTVMLRAKAVKVIGRFGMHLVAHVAHRCELADKPTVDFGLAQLRTELGVGHPVLLKGMNLCLQEGWLVGRIVGDNRRKRAILSAQIPTKHHVIWQEKLNEKHVQDNNTGVGMLNINTPVKGPSEFSEL